MGESNTRVYGYHTNDQGRDGLGGGDYLNHYGYVTIGNHRGSGTRGWSDLVPTRVTHAYGNVSEFNGCGNGGAHGNQNNGAGDGMSYATSLPEPECSFMENYGIARDMGVPECVLELEILADPTLSIFEDRPDNYTW